MPLMPRKSSSNSGGHSTTATVILDDALADHPLRIVALLNKLRVTVLTYPYKWRLIGSSACSLVPHEWILDEHARSLVSADTSLAIISSLGIESAAPRFSISSTVDGFVEQARENRLWIVVDDRTFRFHGELRPIAEEPWASLVKHDELYEQISRWFERRGWSFPLRDTKSVYFQLQAAVYNKVLHEDCSRLETLIHNLPEAPFLTLWEDLGRCLNFGIAMPSLRGSDVAVFLSRYAEVSPESLVLRKFCELLFDSSRSLLDRAERVRICRARWSRASPIITELARIESDCDIKGE